ncbi:hypothetical protein E1301_Tti020279 [Triplophysa tibetana]|uniref:Uncharacterized protein n=1 Tax=Triplophysa tibetana TaxID=1572043 RepID=A0A5A9MXC2_9TELE|nr:hypothetical protein E1301_Tti020279 [Triplophysa tibetana]
MMRVLVFCTVVCVLLAEGDEKRALARVFCAKLSEMSPSGGWEDPVEDTVLMHNGCALQCHFLLCHPIAAQEGRVKCRINQSANTYDVLKAKERHEGLLRELQELAEHESERERDYGRDRDEGFEQKDTDGDEDERVMKKEQNERDLEELLETSDRTQDEGEEEKMETEELMTEVQKVKEELKLLEEKEVKDTQSRNREQEKHQKQEELQELLKKISQATNQTQQKREMENASDEATRQFERERDRQTNEDEDEELLEIEAELRKVAADLRQLHRG